MPGKELKGRYRIIEVIGNGGFGKAYLAEDTHRPGSPYCVVKQLMPICKDVEFLQMAGRLFKTEAETLEKLGKHPQIPQLLAYFEEDEEFYLVEEYIRGACLKDELSLGKGLSGSQVVNLLKDVLQIFVFIHNQGVIHRDVKPSNIVRREQDGELVLIDFGAVKQIQPQVLREQGSVTLTTLTVAIGTNDYIPLEQLAGQPRFNSDIYALGIIGIQALTGVLPSQLKRDAHTGAVVWRHLAQVKQDLAEIIDKMTHPAFVERYQSATAVLQDLERLEHFSSVTPPTIAPTVVASPLAQTSFHHSVLSSEQHVKLEELLRECVGAIGPLLLQQDLAKVSSAEELVENLLTRLPQHQRLEFQRRAMAYLQTFAIQKEPTVQYQSSACLTSKFQTVNDSFMSRCEQELTDLVGPISTILIQRAIESHPQSSLEETVAILAAKIPDPQKAAEFRRRLLS